MHKYIRKRLLNESNFGLPDKIAGERKTDAKSVFRNNDDFITKGVAESVNKFLLKNYDHRFIDDNHNESQFCILGYHSADIEGSEDVNTYMPSIDVSLDSTGNIDIVLKIVEGDRSIKAFWFDTCNITKHTTYKPDILFSMYIYDKNLDYLDKIAESLEVTIRSEYGGKVSVKYEQYCTLEREIEKDGLLHISSVSEDIESKFDLAPTRFGDMYITYYVSHINIIWSVDYNNGYNCKNLLDFLNRRIKGCSKRLIAYYNAKDYGDFDINSLEKTVGGNIPDESSIKFEGVILDGIKNVTDLSWVKSLCKVSDPYVIYILGEIQKEIEKADESGEDKDSLYFTRATHGKIGWKMFSEFGKLYDDYALLAYYVNSRKVHKIAYEKDLFTKIIKERC